MAGWKFFYKPEATGMPFISSVLQPSSDQKRLVLLAGSSTVPEMPIVTKASSLWGDVHDLASFNTLGSYVTTQYGLSWPAVGNLPTGKKFDMYIRFHATVTGGAISLCGMTGPQNAAKAATINFYKDSGTDFIEAGGYNENQVRFFNFVNVSTAAHPWVIGTRYDYLFRFDYTANPCTITMYINGVAQTVTTASTDFNGDLGINGMMLNVGSGHTVGTTNMLLEHFGVYDGHHASPGDFSPGGAIDTELLALVGSVAPGGGGGGVTSPSLGGFGF